MALQTTKIKTSLVRSGQRYGLRVANQDAETVHNQHRPDLVFLQGGDMKRFRVGPLPYGTSKASISNICRHWGWAARPVGPCGQSPDKTGSFWHIQAREDPSHWIWQLSHGDVLVSPLSTAPEVTKPMTPVLASARTLSSLKQTKREATSAGERSSDPWAHWDPWTKTATKQPREMSTSQVASIEANMERRILSKLKSEDADMHPVDDRVTALEQQMEQLTATVHSNQQQQQQQASAVQQQLVQLDRKVDGQMQAINTTLDSKLSEQMAKIEMLFSKRPRMD